MQFKLDENLPPSAAGLLRSLGHEVMTVDDYENLVDQAGDARNCRIAFDGEDIELTLGPFHERQKSLRLLAGT